jgi:outer membrane receptor protein involved in Fe transport
MLRYASRPLALTLLAHAAAWGQGFPEDREGVETRSLETVTVRARRSIEQRFYSVGSMVVVDRSDIEQLGAFSVTDVLRQLPGVQVTPQSDGSVEIRMRGMERAATQILIDGQAASGGARAQLALANVPAELVERIEVIRSPSAEFPGASAGTINIVLRQATVKRETVIRATDNHAWGRDAGQVFFSRTGPLPGQPVLQPDELSASRPWSYIVAASGTGLLFGSNIRRRIGRESGVSTSDAESRYRWSELSLMPRLNGNLGGGDQIALRGIFTRAHVPGSSTEQVGSTTADNVPYTLSTRDTSDYMHSYAQGAVDWIHRLPLSRLETTLSASQLQEDWQRMAHLLLASAGAPAYVPSVFRDRRHESFYSLGTKLTGTGSSLLWTIGAQVERRRLDAHTRSEGSAPLDLRLQAVLDRTVLWGQNEWEVWNGGALTAGLRMENLRIRAADGMSERERRIDSVQPSLHLRKQLSETLQYRANLARITRQPRVWDLVDRTLPSIGSNSIVNPDARGNPDLRPETAWTLDTGFERRLQADGQMGANLFVRRMRDVIAPLTRLAGDRWVEQRMNIGEATVWGLEVDVKSNFKWPSLQTNWTLSANASLLQSRVTSGIGKGSRIPGQARYTANLTIAKPIPYAGGMFGGGTLSLTGPAAWSSSPGMAGYDRSRATLDLYVGTVVRGWGTWRIGVYNLGDAPLRRTGHYMGSVAGMGMGTGTDMESRMTLGPRLQVSFGTQF